MRMKTGSYEQQSANEEWTRTTLLHFWQLNLDLFKSSDVGTQKTSNGSFMCLIVWLGNCFGGPFSRNITILTECYPDCKDQLPPLILTDWTLNRNRHTNSIPCHGHWNDHKTRRRQAEGRVKCVGKILAFCGGSARDKWGHFGANYLQKCEWSNWLMSL